MKAKPWLTAMLAGALLSGCDRDQTASTKPPATQPAAAASTTQSADASIVIDPSILQPPPHVSLPKTSSFLVHDGVSDRIYDFPAAILRLTKHEEGKYDAVLYSNDPKAALNPGYTGNSFYLQMKLDIDDPHKLVNVPWGYRTNSTEHEESGDGIFLQGNRIHLQPSDVAASFNGGDNKLVQVIVAGKFLKFDNQAEPTALHTLVEVRGEFTAIVEIAK
ncbi:MAG TPA: hypothetical protein VH370_22775 [Humisphaera sp.]|nr:hypothetical protein [Humisphaera sp.]